jgi:hypothetical protein
VGSHFQVPRIIIENVNRGCVTMQRFGSTLENRLESRRQLVRLFVGSHNKRDGGHEFGFALPQGSLGFVKLLDEITHLMRQRLDGRDSFLPQPRFFLQ